MCNYLTESYFLSGRRAQQANASVRAAFVHVVGDLLQSISVLVSAIIIFFKVRGVSLSLSLSLSRCAQRVGSLQSEAVKASPAIKKTWPQFINSCFIFSLRLCAAPYIRGYKNTLAPEECWTTRGCGCLLQERWCRFLCAHNVFVVVWLFFFFFFFFSGIKADS